MKHIKWKIFIITALVCLLPILLGVALWDQLPDVIATHFDINNNADGFSSKGFAVFGLPLLMVALQFICCAINDINAHFKGERKKFTRLTKWIIPVLTVALQCATFYIALGRELDVRRVVGLLVGVMFILLGNYLPKFDEIRVNLAVPVRLPIDTDKAKKINRFIGFETVIMGILLLVSLLLPPVATAWCLILLIPYALIAIIYGVVVGRKNNGC